MTFGVKLTNRLNPFVSQVGFFEGGYMAIVNLTQQSQSLRKSGRFFPR